MKIDKINTDYGTNLLEKNRDIVSTPTKENIAIPKIQGKFAHSTVELHFVRGRVLEILKVDPALQEIGSSNTKFMQDLLRGKTQQIIELINIMDDNSLEIFLKDGNVISIKHMEDFISIKEVTKLMGDMEMDLPMKELKVFLLENSNTHVLMNGKEGVLSGFLAVDRLDRSILLDISPLGFLLLDSHTLKRILYYLPYLASLHEYHNRFPIFEYIKKYNWRFMILFVLLLLVLIKIF